MFCLLLTDTKILVKMYTSMKTAVYTSCKFRITNRNPIVLINQNNAAIINEFPKKAVTFFENPLTASLKPVYIRHATLSSPTWHETLILFDLNNLAIAISSTLFDFKCSCGFIPLYDVASKNINCPFAAESEVNFDLRTSISGSSVSKI